MSKVREILYDFFWGVFYYRYLLLNKNISREKVMDKYQSYSGVDREFAKYIYAYSVGLVDREYTQEDSEGFIYVNKSAMRRRKWYMREGDIEWWYGKDTLVRR